MLGQILHNTYRVERILGRGGMGTVYDASHLRLSRRFAVKVLHVGVDNDEALGRFRREAEISSALGHPNIVEVIDIYRTDAGLPYIIMELLEGQDLARLLALQGRLPLPRMNEVLGQICDALGAAHRRGIVHRDLKPNNIFLCRTESRGEVVKVVDFGISKVMGSHSVITRGSAILGTPAYMAPEQAEGRSAEAGPGADVYATGAMIFECLSGATPHQADTVHAMLYKVIHETPPHLGEACPGLPRAVGDVVARAMSRDPGDRYASMGELDAAFQAACSSGGVERVVLGAPGVPFEGRADEQTVQRAVPDEAVEVRLTNLEGGHLTARISGEEAGGLPTEGHAAGPAPDDPATVHLLRTAQRKDQAPTVHLLRAGHRRPRRPAAILALGLVALALSAGVVVWRLTAASEGDLQEPTAVDASEVAALPSPSRRAHAGSPAAGDAPKADTGPAARAKTGPGAAAASPVPRPRQRRRGTLRVGTLRRGRPSWAEILVDGRPVGRSPLKLKIRAGRHRVEARRPGHPPAVKQVVIRPGQTSTVTLRLRMP